MRRIAPTKPSSVPDARPPRWFYVAALVGIVVMLTLCRCHLMQPVRQGMVESTEIATARFTAWLESAMDRMLDKLAERLEPRMRQLQPPVSGEGDRWWETAIAGAAFLLVREIMRWYRSEHSLFGSGRKSPSSGAKQK